MIYQVGQNNGISISEIAINGINYVADIYVDFIKESYEYKMYGALYEAEDASGKTTSGKKGFLTRVVEFFKRIFNKIADVLEAIADKLKEVFGMTRVVHAKPEQLKKLDDAGKDCSFEYISKETFKKYENKSKTLANGFQMNYQNATPDDIINVTNEVNEFMADALNDSEEKALEKTTYNGSWVDCPKVFSKDNYACAKNIHKNYKMAAKQARAVARGLKFGAKVVDKFMNDGTDDELKEAMSKTKDIANKIIKAGSKYIALSKNMIKFNEAQMKKIDNAAKGKSED